VFFGELPAEFEETVTDITVMDKIAIALLSITLIGIGVFPSLMSPMVQSGVTHVLSLLGGA
jgi:NADH-quinone oxidoreductase subunit M